jgi:hypothetical protein
MQSQKYWQLAYYVLLVCWIIGAFLTMNKINAGFFSSYLSDLTNPAWLYIMFRTKWTPEKSKNRVLNWFGSNPERVAFSIITIGVITELSSKYWPQGLFKGTYDPWDVFCYTIGVMICYLIDRIEISLKVADQKIIK